MIRIPKRRRDNVIQRYWVKNPKIFSLSEELKSKKLDEVELVKLPFGEAVRSFTYVPDYETFNKIKKIDQQQLKKQVELIKQKGSEEDKKVLGQALKAVLSQHEGNIELMGRYPKQMQMDQMDNDIKWNRGLASQLFKKIVSIQESAKDERRMHAEADIGQRRMEELLGKGLPNALKMLDAASESEKRIFAEQGINKKSLEDAHRKREHYLIHEKVDVPYSDEGYIKIEDLGKKKKV